MRCLFHARIFFQWVLLIALTTIAIPAHHGASGFDPSKEITIEGTVTDFSFRNPHVQITLEALGARGEAVSWQAELPAPNTLIRAGWNKRTLQRGDRVTMTGFPAWRGERSLWVRKISKAGGHELSLTSEIERGKRERD